MSEEIKINNSQASAIIAEFMYRRSFHSLLCRRLLDSGWGIDTTFALKCAIRDMAVRHNG